MSKRTYVSESPAQFWREATVKAWKEAVRTFNNPEFDEDGKGGLYKEAAKLEWSEEREAFKKAKALL